LKMQLLGNFLLLFQTHWIETVVSADHDLNSEQSLRDSFTLRC